ncbi:MAG: ATP-dependent phosphofructokinase / diphosphate-dependent phosphofructokinase [Thermoanaerobacteraceae bacterium]|nr:ATP-dependent phosphofructokinase / diphosphate-dependent phosphofructokinase [Thermoanaerobacteraceae bacterium]
MTRNVLFAQSGGPTAVINASCYGIIKEAKKSSGKIYAARYGVEGLMKENLIEMTDIDDAALEVLRYSPSSAFGSCRHKLKEDEFEAVFKIFDKYNIGYFFYIGGNDSMTTADKLSKYALKVGYDIKAVGIPKTIDNDLPITDFCPGYGSAAKYVAASVKEMTLDSDVYDKGIVTIVEIMGRDSGFLTAASALAKDEVIDSPHLIYLPEVPFDENEFLKDVERAYSKKKKVFITASEGLKNKDGQYAFLRESSTDAFNNMQMGGIGKYLEHLVKTNVEKRVKAVELSILQRSAAHIASRVDNDVAVMVGSDGVKYAMDGMTDIMVSIVRTEDGFKTSPVPLGDIAGKIKTFPLEWIDKDNRWVTREAIDYMLPLIQGEAKVPYEKGLPKYIRFI